MVTTEAARVNNKAHVDNVSNVILRFAVHIEKAEKQYYAMCERPSIGGHGKTAEAAFDALHDTLRTLFEGFAAQHMLEEVVARYGVAVTQPTVGRFGLVSWKDPIVADGSESSATADRSAVRYVWMSIRSGQDA